MDSALSLIKSKAPRNADVRFHLCFMSFLCGSVLFSVLKPDLAPFFELLRKVTDIASFSIACFGCTFLLFILILVAPSVFGFLLIPLVDVLCGFALSALSGFIIPLITPDTKIMIPLIMSVCAVLFTMTVISASGKALRISRGIFIKLKSDKHIRIITIKLLLTFAIVSAVLMSAGVLLANI